MKNSNFKDFLVFSLFLIIFLVKHLKLGVSLNYNELEPGLKEYRAQSINLFEMLYWFDCKPTLENIGRTVDIFKKYGGVKL